MVAQVALAFSCVALTVVPFLGIDLVPSTDLPQHLGQMRLFERAWNDPASGLTIQWGTPYWLVYAVVAVAWVALPPLAAAWAAALGLLVLQTVSIQILGTGLGRPLAARALATAFVFNQLFYWGFLNFQFGWLPFVAWFLVSRRRPGEGEAAWKEPVIFAGLAVVLYLSHALWFALAVAWLPLEAWLSGRRREELGRRLVGLAPVALAAAGWFIQVRSSSFATGAEWGLQQFSRIDLRSIVLGALGGVRHPVELIVVIAALLWIALALVAHRREPWLGCDRYLATLTLVFVVLYAVLPDKYVNTIRFSSRWLPYLFITALLAVGRPPLGKIGRAAVAGLLLVALVATTAVAWRGFEETELAGFSEALTALPDSPRRVLGLNYLEESRYLWVRPFRQMFAWAQVAKGGELSFSFGYFATSLVVYDDLDRVVWTRNLDNYPELLQATDFEHFDFVLVGGGPDAHARMSRFPELAAVTSGGLWRLYQAAAGGAPEQP